MAELIGSADAVTVASPPTTMCTLRTTAALRIKKTRETAAYVRPQPLVRILAIGTLSIADAWTTTATIVKIATVWGTAVAVSILLAVILTIVVRTAEVAASASSVHTTANAMRVGPVILGCADRLRF